MTESSNNSSDRPLRKPRAFRRQRDTKFNGDAPRPMTAVTRALLERKRRAPGPVPSSVAKRKAAEQGWPLVLLTQDGKVSYALTSKHPGLQVERTMVGRPELRVSQILFFADRASFDHWCDTDPLRFQQPLLLQEIKQQGHRLLDGHAAASGAP